MTTTTKVTKDPKKVEQGIKAHKTYLKKIKEGILSTSTPSTSLSTSTPSSSTSTPSFTLSNSWPTAVVVLSVIIVGCYHVSRKKPTQQQPPPPPSKNATFFHMK